MNVFRLAAIVLFVIGGLVAGNVIDWMTWQAWGLFGVAAWLCEPLMAGLTVRRAQ